MRSGRSGERFRGRRLGYALAALVAVSAAQRAEAMQAPPAEMARVTAPAAVELPLAASNATDPLPQQLDALRMEVSELRASLRAATQADVPPGWATEMQSQIDRRLERMAEMQERLAARIETPTPRLDEPIVLFTVAGCTLLLGFVVGRGVQRRSNRRDLRLRL